MKSIFISYSHDSPEHREKVLSLAERLRRDGLEAIIDRYVNGSPPAGWPRWMLNGLNAASNVLCICTETYCRRFLGQELPGKGKGADWEGALISQALYDLRSNTNKFIPVLFEAKDEAHIPAPLRSQTYYLVDSEPNYQALYDALLGRAGIKPAPIGELMTQLPTASPPLMCSDPKNKSFTPPRASSAAVVIWQEKLEFLLVEDAICVDPAMKFRLKHLIREAEEKLGRLGA